MTAQDRPLPSVSVVIPTFNEAETLPHVLPRIPLAPTRSSSWTVIGGDDTVAVARRCRPDIQIVYEDGKGKGDALTCGFAQATGDIIVMLDADGSTDPSEIPRFVATLLTGADFVEGFRFITAGGSADITPLRKAGNKALSRSSTCSSAPTTATSATAMPPSGVAAPPFRSIARVRSGNADDVRAARASLPVAEVASFEGERIHGDST